MKSKTHDVFRRLAALAERLGTIEPPPGIRELPPTCAPVVVFDPNLKQPLQKIVGLLDLEAGKVSP